MDKKPTFMLYRANCHADGCSEGFFLKSDRADKRTMENYSRAMKTVEEYLNDESLLQFSGVYDLVSSEKEAQKLISIFQKEFEGINPIIKLSNCVHGRIIFDRKIEFGKHNLDDIDDLISKIKDFDYMKQHHIDSHRLEESFFPERFF